MNKIKIFLFTCLIIGFTFLSNVSSNAAEPVKPYCRYPDYVYEYLGYDKFEKFNRKMFNFNSGLNKYAIRPVHIIWASIMPKYGMDRIKGVATNIEYPARLVSSLIQRDFENSKNETIRFFTNTTLGLGGMYDPAKRFLKIEPSTENMEQAFAKCKLKPGPYLVCPVINGTSPRGLVGRALDAALNPSCYIATPVLAIVKAGLLVNKTSYMQPIIKMVESNYADPYDIARKLYGVENYIKCRNLDRKEVLDTAIDLIKENKTIDNPEEPELVKNDGLYPWFDLGNPMQRKKKQYTLVFGHWAALGAKCQRPFVKALDTGCVWGDRLSCWCFDTDKTYRIKSLGYTEPKVQVSKV